MTRILLHHPRAGRRLALRRGLEAAGFAVDVMSAADALRSAPEDAVVVADGESRAFVEAREALGRRRLILIGGSPVTGAERIDSAAPVEALLERLRGSAAEPSATDADRGVEPSANEPVAVDGMVHAGGLDAVVERIDRLAPVDLPVLIVGESGCGKDVVARALHARGPRRDRPLVTVHVGVTAGELLESELFGHVRGAFTDAVSDREGRLEAAGDGTLLLDEVADVPVGLQATFLRVLQDRRFSRVGETTERSFNARVVGTTQRDLEAEIARGTFREDLYHRLAGAVIHVPPLRQRPHDLPILAHHLLARATGAGSDTPPALTAGALSALREHGWPGNVRELDHVLQRAWLLAGDDPIDEVHVRTTLRDSRSVDPDRDLEAVLRRWIQARRARGADESEIRQSLDARIDQAVREVDPDP